MEERPPASPLYQALADYFVAEGVRRVFGLMGDGNMLWMAAMAERADIEVVHARHENSAVAMAAAYAEAGGQGPGVCSVTCGPGIAQIPTSLAIAARRRTPLVVFAGDTPRGADYHLQALDPGPLIRATGAAHVPLREVETASADVRTAFWTAQHERRPVVLTAPYDLQEREHPGSAYRAVADLPSADAQALEPDPAAVTQAAQVLASASRPVVLAGRGALDPACLASLVQLADHTGALLATTLAAKGAFDGHAFDLGIAGGYSPDHIRSLLVRADVVLAVGASLSHYTTLGGALFDGAEVVQVDRRPVAFYENGPAADLPVRGDAALTSSRLLDELQETPRAEGFRSPEVEQVLADGVAEPTYELEPDTVDPRAFFADLDRALPRDWFVVTGAGHFSNFAVQFLRGTSPEDQLYTSPGFGVIGQGIAAAIGVTRARPDQSVVLLEGDGSLTMNIQELDTLARTGGQVCVIVANDGAFGAEVHKLRPKGGPEDESVFGRPDFAGIAQSFGIDGVRIDATTGDIATELSRFGRRSGPMVLDVHVSRTVPSIRYRRLA